MIYDAQVTKPSVHTKDVVVFQPGVHAHGPRALPRSVL